MKKSKVDYCGICAPKKFLGQRKDEYEYIDREGNRVVSLGDHRFEVHQKDGTVLVYGPNKYSPSIRGRN